MTTVFVHGVPETYRIWDGVRDCLPDRATIALSLPGFGCPLPDGFVPNMDSYAAWLIKQLEATDGPVDLVGHDRGGGFTLRLVSLRPDLVLSWVTDAAGLADVDFAWHQVATIWQTPEAGEGLMDAQLAATPADRAALFAAGGLSDEAAFTMANGFDRLMADSILTLYRSATEVHEEWGPAFVDIPKPGMAVVATADACLDVESAERAAQRAGARITRLEGAGHWWMAGDDPAAAAKMLEEFWDSL